MITILCMGNQFLSPAIQSATLLQCSFLWSNVFFEICAAYFVARNHSRTYYQWIGSCWRLPTHACTGSNTLQKGSSLRTRRLRIIANEKDKHNNQVKPKHAAPNDVYVISSFLFVRATDFLLILPALEKCVFSNLFHEFAACCTTIWLLNQWQTMPAPKWNCCEE